MTKALITGITGFAGSHLAEWLLASDISVSGIYRWRSRMDNIEHIQKDIELIEADIRDSFSVERVVREVRPDYIFHLAAQSFIPQSYQAPSETISTNVLGCLNILEAVRESGLDCIVHIAGSSEEYGSIQLNETPIKETNPLRPRSQYAVSKVAQDLLGQQYWHSHKVWTVITRAFNHSGPRRGEPFCTSNFAKQIAEIEAGIREPVIRHGNLEAMRDFSDVRDVVKAYLLAVQKCEPGQVYNICSGRSVSIDFVLHTLLFMSDVSVEMVQDPARMRPSDISIFVGDCSKFKKQTGWVPQYQLEATLKDLLNYWREKIARRESMPAGSGI